VFLNVIEMIANSSPVHAAHCTFHRPIFIRLSTFGLFVLLAVFSGFGGELAGLGQSVNNRPRPLYRINPENGQVTSTVLTPFSAATPASDLAELGLASGDGALWSLGYSVNLGPRALYKLNPANGSLLQKIDTALRPEGLGDDFVPRSLAYGEGFVWGLGDLVNKRVRSLFKIDSKTGQIVQTIPTTFKPVPTGSDVADIGLAYGNGFLWGFGYAVNNGGRPLYKISPKDGTIVETLMTTFRPAVLQSDVASHGLAYGGGHLWALGYSVNKGPRPLYKISPATGQTVQTITSGIKADNFGGDIAPFGLAYIE
jgi:hypothetical protein